MKKSLILSNIKKVFIKLKSLFLTSYLVNRIILIQDKTDKKLKKSYLINIIKNEVKGSSEKGNYMSNLVERIMNNLLVKTNKCISQWSLGSNIVRLFNRPVKFYESNISVVARVISISFLSGHTILSVLFFEVNPVVIISGILAIFLCVYNVFKVYKYSLFNKIFNGFKKIIIWGDLDD